MTRNIKASFSSSLGGEKTFKEYEVVVGSTFTDVYNEELDSATILLAHVPLEDRLTDIKPYDFVRIWDENSFYSEYTDTYAFEHVYLVDNYYEKEERITENRLFSYTIKLMSLTKLLEKIQCPNLTIIHDIKNGVINKKTIFQKICEYMELYVPKIKKLYMNGDTECWRYEPLIENPGRMVISRHMTTTRDIVAGGTYNAEFEIGDLYGISINDLHVAVDFSREHLSVKPNTMTCENGVLSFDYTSDLNMRYVTFTTTVNVSSDTVQLTGGTYETYRTGYQTFYEKFNVTTADLGSSYFTLRQLLTMLMQQVKCIPVVFSSENKLKLGFLDFDAPLPEISSEDTIHHVERSLSSDSFANTLVNTSSNVLDSENVVISETIGFRDKSNVLLKQEDNLFLETKFPIYKVNKFKMNFLLQNAIANKTFKLGNVGTMVYYSMDASKTGNEILVKVHFSGGGGVTVSGENCTFYITGFNYNNNKIVWVEDYEATINFSQQIWGADPHIEFTAVCSENFDYYIIQMVGTLKWDDGIAITDEGEGFLSYSPSDSPLNSSMFVAVDITPLIKESQERATLKTNFKEMTPATTIEQLSQYIYGTVGYTIGDNKITGFSDKYSQIQGKVFTYTETKTYIENIYNFLKDYYASEKIIDIIYRNTNIILRNREIIEISLFNSSNFINFSQFTFDIEYQPLNSFNLSYVKNENDIDFSIEQLNSSDSGLVDFDRLSDNQQETVDRIGNATLSISQRIPEGQLSNKLFGLPFAYNKDGEKHIVFKRTYSVGNYKYDVNYIGSKNAILKDYFTSIRTKYRAYEYVDYNVSTLRKENDTIFVRIAQDFFDGDDKIKFVDTQGTKRFLTAASTENANPFRYVVEKSYNKSNNEESIKNDVSLISNSNCFAIIYEQFDNVSAGPYVANSSYLTYYDADQQTGLVPENKKLGGVPQAWQEWNLDKYNTRHEVKIVGDLNYYNKVNDAIFYENEWEARYQVDITAQAPILPAAAQQSSAQSSIMYLVDNNFSDNYNKTFYKDVSERLNHTVQFVYYAPYNNVKWTELFIRRNGFTDFSSEEKRIVIYKTNSMDLNSEYHTSYETVISDSTAVQVRPDLGGSAPASILVRWVDNAQYIKVCYSNNDSKVADVIVFKRPDNNPQYTYFYVTLNDTKSDYVMAMQNGILYRYGKVRTGNMDREVVEL